MKIEGQKTKSQEVPSTEILCDLINELVTVISLYLNNYPFDSDHRAKQKILCDMAYRAIGTPLDRKELK